MKKIIVITIMCTLFLTACGKDSVAQKVQDDIESIGEVTLEDEYLIEKTYETYNTLTDKQKNQVNNYADLLDARDKIDELKAEAILSNAIAEQAKEECLSKQRIYYSKIKDRIKNVDFSIDKIVYKCVKSNSESIDDHVYIYSNNKWLGGKYNDFNYELQDDQIKEIEDAFNGKSTIYKYEIGENFYANSEDTSTNPYSCIFLVDLDDFWNY